MAGLLKVLFLSLAITASLFFTAIPAAAQTQRPAGSDRVNEEQQGSKNLQRIIPLSSPVYTELDRLYLLAGKSRPSAARPWSADEAQKIFEALPDRRYDEETTGTENASTAIVKSEILSGAENTGPGRAAGRVTKNINLEGHFKTNSGRKEWEHGYEERKPLVYIPFEGWFFKNLYSTFDLTIREEYAAITGSDDNYTNIPSAPTDLDWYFPFRAFISVGGEHWNIQAGRDKASWGSGVTGNMLLSDYSDFYNLIRFTTYWEKFKFTSVYIGLDPWLTNAEKEIDDLEADNNGLAGGYENFGELYKGFLGHRIEFRLKDNLTLSLSEAIMFGNKYINLTELNPAFVFHNLFIPEYSNAIASVEADYTVLKGLNLYMQFVMDEFQVPGYEDDGSRPGANGLMSGVTLVRLLEKGYLTFNGEAAKTDPYLYNRWHPLTRFTNRRRIWSTYLDKYEYINKPMGYESGPDAVILYGSAGFDRPGKFSASLDGRYSMKGEMNSSLDDPLSYDTGKDASRQKILSGTVEKEFVTGLHSTLKPTNSISLSSDIYWIHIKNYGNMSGDTVSDLELAFSVGLVF
jgi:hypothetical protein